MEEERLLDLLCEEAITLLFIILPEDASLLIWPDEETEDPIDELAFESLFASVLPELLTNEVTEDPADPVEVGFTPAQPANTMDIVSTANNRFLFLLVICLSQNL